MIKKIKERLYVRKLHRRFARLNLDDSNICTIEQAEFIIENAERRHKELEEKFQNDLTPMIDYALEVVEVYGIPSRVKRFRCSDDQEKRVQMIKENKGTPLTHFL